MRKEEKLLLQNFIPPFLFVALLWIIKGLEFYYQLHFSKYGLLPRNIDALTGIITFPLVHGDWDHLISNSAGLLVLGFLLFTFHREIAYRVVAQIWLLCLCFFGCLYLMFYKIVLLRFYICICAFIYGFCSVCF